MAFTLEAVSIVLPKRTQGTRRKSYTKAPTKNRRFPGRSLAASVQKANFAPTTEKHVSVCFADLTLKHNQWTKGKNMTLEHFTSPVLTFDNMFSQITPRNGI